MQKVDDKIIVIFRIGLSTGMLYEPRSSGPDPTWSVLINIGTLIGYHEQS